MAIQEQVSRVDNGSDGQYNNRPEMPGMEPTLRIRRSSCNRGQKVRLTCAGFLSLIEG